MTNNKKIYVGYDVVDMQSGSYCVVGSTGFGQMKHLIASCLDQGHANLICSLLNNSVEMKEVKYDQ